MDSKMVRLLNGQYEAKIREQVNRENKLLHLIFSASPIQAKIALAMIMYGADFDYALATAHHLSREN